MSTPDALFAILVALLVGMALGLAVYALRRRRPARSHPLSRELTRRREALRARLLSLAQSLARRPSIAVAADPAHAAAGKVEALLLAGSVRRAVEVAEGAIRASPVDPRAHLLLARARLYAGDRSGGRAAAARARSLGSRDARLDFLDLRLRPTSAPKLSVERLDDLARVIDAANADPTSGEPAYHAALAAVALGMRDEARLLMEGIAPWMAASPERASFDHDRARLARAAVSGEVARSPGHAETTTPA